MLVLGQWKVTFLSTKKKNIRGPLLRIRAIRSGLCCAQYLSLCVFMYGLFLFHWQESYSHQLSECIKKQACC